MTSSFVCVFALFFLDNLLSFKSTSIFCLLFEQEKCIIGRSKRLNSSEEDGIGIFFIIFSFCFYFDSTVLNIFCR